MTSTVARRTSGPFADMLDWLESATPGMRGLGLAPYVRVEDFIDNGTYVLRAELPGIDPDKDVELTVEGDMLTIRGQRREEKKDRNHHELHYGSFARSVPLPRDVKADEVTATYTDGVLEVRVPASGPEPHVHKVPVQRQGSD
ncbi:MAG: Hsp20/alpha crystallin family protein [Nocardioides sp.]